MSSHDQVIDMLNYQVDALREKDAQIAKLERNLCLVMLKYLALKIRHEKVTQERVKLMFFHGLLTLWLLLVVWLCFKGYLY